MQKGPVFYGWYVVAASFLNNFMAAGTGFYVINAFMQPLCVENGWTRIEVSLAISIGGLAGLFFAMLFGFIVNRIGPRLLMTIGPVISAAAFILTGFAHNLSFFYLGFLFLYLGNSAMAGIVSNAAVNNWFVVNRGKALGVSTAGISLAGVIVPFVALLILEGFGLTKAFIIVGAFNFLLAPMAWLVVRNRPEDHGLIPDGIALNPELQSAASPQSSDVTARESRLGPWTFRSLVRELTFWKVGISYGLILVGVIGVMSQLKPRFSDIGFDDKTAMLMMAMTALAGTMGKFVWGTLCDHFDPRRVTAVLMAMIGLGLGFMLSSTSITGLLLFVVVFGFAMGGVLSTLPIMVADLFGRNSFAEVLKFVVLFLSIQYIGPVAMGFSFDRAGSYDPAYIFFILLAIVSAALVLSIKRPLTRKAET